MKRLVNILVVFCAALALSVNIAFAGDFSASTSNTTIAAALNKLESINKYDTLRILAGQNATGKPIRVFFRDLAIYGQSTSEALTVPSNNGGLVIMINRIHENAPVEAIACLIAHEATHHEMSQTLDEELRAWGVETRTWIAFTEQNPSLKMADAKLTKRLNYLSKLYVRDGYQMTSIENLVASNSAYQNLKGNTYAAAQKTAASARSIQ